MDSGNAGFLDSSKVPLEFKSHEIAMKIKRWYDPDVVNLKSTPKDPVIRKHLNIIRLGFLFVCL